MSSNHRDRRRPSRRRHPALEPIVRLIHEKAGDHSGHVAAYVRPVGGGELDVGLRPLGLEHPFSVLAGFSAPPEWTMFGVRVTGTARFADVSRPPEPNSTTFVVSRHGDECSLVQSTSGARVLAGPAEGLVPDACRRVLEVPTAPAPRSPAGLFTVVWLDRVLEAMGDPDRRSGLCRRWSALAALHPAVDGTSPESSLEEPEALVQLGAVHVAEWPWHRLRAEPASLALPEGTLPARVTGWMDDGFYARWAFGAFPSAATLSRDVLGLLDQPLKLRLLQALDGLLAEPPA